MSTVLINRQGGLFKLTSTETRLFMVLFLKMYLINKPIKSLRCFHVESYRYNV